MFDKIALQLHPDAAPPQTESLDHRGPGAQEEVELPLKLLMLGDYTQRADPRPLEDRKPISVDKDNFSKVMSEQKLNLNFAVADKLSEEEGNEQ